MYKIIRRTFAAKTAKGDDKAELNAHIQTSEYLPDFQYAIVSERVVFSYKTKKEAQEALARINGK